MSANKVNKDIRLAGKSGIRTILYDSDGNITFDSGATPPTGAGYAIGALFVQNDAATPGERLYVNAGSAAAALFVPYAQQTGAIALAIPIVGSNMVVDPWAWAPDRAYVIGATMTMIKSVISAGVSALTVRKVAAGVTVPSLGTALHGGTFTLGSAVAIDTVQTIATTVNTLAATDKIAFSTSASPAGVVGVISMALYPA